MAKKVGAIIQARCGSTRLPNKIFAQIAGKPLLEHVIHRLEACKNLNDIIVATTENTVDDTVYDWCINRNCKVFRGSENNVLKRYYDAAKKFKVDVVVRITADNPFKEPFIIDELVNIILKGKHDYVCNNNPPSFPEGLDVEVFTFASLEKAYLEARGPDELEHVTPYFYNNPDKFQQFNYKSKKNLTHLRWTIDTKEDLDFARLVYNDLYSSDKMFLMGDILRLLCEKPELLKINQYVKRSLLYRNMKGD
jgi:spore coat polysaccharide biosynthesis protein SpsF